MSYMEKEALLQEMNPVEFGVRTLIFVYDQESTWMNCRGIEAGTPHAGHWLRHWLFRRNWDGEYPSAWTRNSLLSLTKDARNGRCDGIWAKTRKTFWVASFTIDGIHPHDVATALDMEGFAVRAGTSLCTTLMQDGSRITTCQVFIW